MHANFRIGISSCLLGNMVRWNAGHNLDRFLTNTLGQFVEYAPVCPEVEAGFGIPREPLRLVGKLVAEGKKLPLKELLDRYVQLMMEALAAQNHAQEKYQRPPAPDGIFQKTVEYR